MKRTLNNTFFLGTLLAIAMVFLLGFAACSGPSEVSSSQVSSSVEANSMPSLLPAGTYALGLGAQTAVMGSSAVNEATEKWPGTAEAFTTVCAVLLDSQGNIADVRFDKTHMGANFTAEGMLSTVLGYQYNSFYDDEAGSEPVLESDLGYSWCTQIDAFCTWAKGQSAYDVLHMPLVAGDVPGSFVADEQLSAVVTIDISDMLHALQNAVANAVDIQAESGISRLGLTLYAQFSPYSADAALDTDGQVIPGFVRFESNFGAMVLDGTGSIVGARFDATQNDIYFDNLGALHGPNDDPTLTKVEKGNSYGMRRISSIGKEWFEQIAALEQWVLGKTPEEVASLLEGPGKIDTSDVDLVASVTIDISDFVHIVQRNADRLRSSAGGE